MMQVRQPIWGVMLLLGLNLVGCGEKQAVADVSPPVAAVQSQSAADGKRVALVIGNSGYADAPLNNPVNDADRMAETLGGLGFAVTKATNLNQKEMVEAIRAFGDKLDKGSIGLFYFSGHGTQVGGKNYLIPVGADIQREDEVAYAAVDADAVLAKMESARNGLNMLILDACRDNPFSRSFRSSSKGLARMDAPTGTVIVYATSPGDVAADGSGKNGLFTSHLLQHITTPGIDIGETLRLTRVGVVQQSEREGKKQVPWESSSLLTRFCFAGCASQQVVTPTPLPTAPVAAPPAPVPAAAPAVSPVPTRQAFEPEMVAIPAGSFTMGCDGKRDDVEGGCSDDEKPAHEVSISAFQMAKTEVTFDQWDACEKAKACPHAEDEGWGRGNRPVINVSWNNITQKYIPWLNQQTNSRYRLPTEAEWEYAARGGADTAYPWGNSISCSNAVYGYTDCSNEKTKPVGSYAENGYDLYDMHGNVWEWCQDWYDSGYYASSPASDPQGASSGTSRVLRGGSWGYDAQSVRSADRDRSTPDFRYYYMGFRLASGQD